MQQKVDGYVTLQGWMAISAMSRDATYKALSRGNLKAKKLGRRIVIDLAHGLEYMRSLPDADIRLASAPRQVEPRQSTSRQRTTFPAA